MSRNVSHIGLPWTAEISIGWVNTKILSSNSQEKISQLVLAGLCWFPQLGGSWSQQGFSWSLLAAWNQQDISRKCLAPFGTSYGSTGSHCTLLNVLLLCWQQHYRRPLVCANKISKKKTGSNERQYLRKHTHASKGKTHPLIVYSFCVVAFLMQCFVLVVVFAVTCTYIPQ